MIVQHYRTLAVHQRTPGVAQVTMPRPSVFNAFDETMIAEMDAVFADLQWMQRANQASREWNLDEAREGFAAFLEKRPANWIPHT